MPDPTPPPPEPMDRAGGATPSVCVYCGSSAGADPRYADAARRFGQGLAAEGFRLVYGAGDLGLMGETAKGCVEAGGRAFGVIPRGLWEREVTSRALPDVVVVDTLHQRKTLMLTNADALAVLPGGIGTLDEAVEALSWALIGLHKKPIVFLNIAEFWTPLYGLLAHLAREGFLSDQLFDCFEMATDAESAIVALKARLARAP